MPQPRPDRAPSRLAKGPTCPTDRGRRPAIVLSPKGEQIRIHGRDARGVLRGVWYLEDLMLLRGGPMVKRQAITREPRYAPRATCAAWGGTGELCTPVPVYTDEHLRLDQPLRLRCDLDHLVAGAGTRPAAADAHRPRPRARRTYLSAVHAPAGRPDRACRAATASDVVINAVPPYPADDGAGKSAQPSRPGNSSATCRASRP